QSGLGAEAAFTVAGVFAANNLLGNPYPRSEVLNLAAQMMKRADHVMTTILGGATATASEGDTLISRTLPLAPLKIIAIVPDLPGFVRDTPDDEQVSLE